MTGGVTDDAGLLSEHRLGGLTVEREAALRQTDHFLPIHSTFINHKMKLADLVRGYTHISFWNQQLDEKAAKHFLIYHRDSQKEEDLSNYSFHTLIAYIKIPK